MANLLAPVPGITPFERKQLVTDVRFNTMVLEIAQKISESGGDKVGNLSDLTTANKSSAVGAINEVNSAIGQRGK